MTRSLRFFKTVASGNDFILLDQKDQVLPSSPTAFARDWCDRRRGIGADGMLLVLPSRKADARMRIFNSDGSEAEMCGNGLRCVAWYLHIRNHGKREFRLETRGGLMQAKIIGHERVRIQWTSPKQLRLGLELTHRGKHYLIHSVNSSVPHAVLFVRRLQAAEPEVLGPVIRHHRFFKPGGTNVNWVQIHSPHKISVRTFERGVEAETPACGTGAIASVLIGTALKRLKPPVQVRTQGGNILTVGFRQEPRPWEGLYLEGPAKILFEGKPRG